MKSKPIWQLAISLLVACSLMILPLPHWLMIYRPQWVALVMLFYFINQSVVLSVWFVLAIGVVLDILNGSLMGEHAAALLLMYVAVAFWGRRFKFYSLLHQLIAVAGFVLIYVSVILLVELLVGNYKQLPWLWLSAFTTTLFWPWLGLLHKHDGFSSDAVI